MRPPIVSKIRRTKSSAYGANWYVMSEAVKKRDGYKCTRCGRTLKDKGVTRLEAHHVIPVSRGGTTCMANLTTQCNLCHPLNPFHRHMR